MEVGHLTVELRTDTGKSAVRKLRNQGLVPGICYGPGGEPVQISFESKALQKALDPLKGRNTLLRMRISGKSNQELAVLLQDTQQDALRGDLLHADFLRVDVKKPVRVVIPIVVSGKAAGVVAGGYLHLEHRTLPLMALPEKIPTKIEVDITNLGMNESIHVADLNLSEGLSPLLSPDTTICVISPHKEEKAASPQAAIGDAAAAPADAKKSDGKDDKSKAAAKPAAKGK